MIGKSVKRKSFQGIQFSRRHQIYWFRFYMDSKKRSAGYFKVRTIRKLETQCVVDKNL